MTIYSLWSKSYCLHWFWWWCGGSGSDSNSTGTVPDEVGMTQGSLVGVTLLLTEVFRPAKLTR